MLTTEISYIDASGVNVRESLAQACLYPLEHAQPVRKVAAYRGMKHMPGKWWFAPTKSLVAYESLLERDVLMLIDFEKAEGVAAQPFRLHFAEATGVTSSHVPDFFTVSGGRGCLIDVTPGHRRDDPKRARVFELTADACRIAGWSYRVESEPPPRTLANLRALSGFRVEPAELPGYAAPLLRACRSARPLGEVCAEVGPSVLVRPVLFHLIWARRIEIDLEAPLANESLVSATRRAGSRA